MNKHYPRGSGSFFPLDIHLLNNMDESQLEISEVELKVKPTYPIG